MFRLSLLLPPDNALHPTNNLLLLATLPLMSSTKLKQCDSLLFILLSFVVHLGLVSRLVTLIATLHGANKCQA
jgi:hypothetical protein